MNCFAHTRKKHLLRGVLLLCFVAGGCAVLAVPEEQAHLTPLAPRWDAGELSRHLKLFNQSPEGRATGSEGLARASAYVAARMREFLLQPAGGGSYFQRFRTAVNRTAGLSVVATGPDTLAFLPGQEVWPDGRSDEGTVDVERAVVRPEGGVLPAGQLVVWPLPAATRADLEAVRTAGAPAVLLVGRLDPRSASAPVRGLVVVQATLSAAARMFGVSVPGMSLLLEGPENRERRLPRPLRLTVSAGPEATTDAVNVMGYVPGKHAERARELVIVCADLDDAGVVPGAPMWDTRYLGTGAAALLELARAYSGFATYLPFPDRTILFVTFSGARQELSGLRAFMENPPWPKDAIRAMLYLDPDTAALAGATRLRRAAPFPFVPLYVPDSLRLPGMSIPEDQGAPDEPPGKDEIIMAARQGALALLAEAHWRLMRESVDPAPPYIPPRKPVFGPHGGFAKTPRR